MHKALKIVGLIGLGAVSAFGLWYYQPWADYSPAKVAALQDDANLGYNFQHMREFLPFRALKGGTPRQLPRDISPMLERFPVEGTEMTPAEFHEEAATSGLMVLKDGVVVHESYYKGAAASSQHTSWSVAKSFVATAIMMAVEEGRIASLSDTAETYATQYAGTDFGAASIGGLLAMSSGIEFDEDYAKDGSDIRRFFFDAFIKRENVDGLLAPYKRTRAEFADFTYISPNSQVLSAVLRGIYDKPLADIISEKIWGPAGMAGEAYWSMHAPGDEGIALGYCCLNATSADYARFGQFWLETIDGQGIGATLLPSTAKKWVTQPATDDHHPNAGNYGGRGYSHHFWLPPAGDGDEGEAVGDVFMAVGVYGQYIWIDTKRKIIIARNAADPKWGDRATKAIAFFRAVARHYAGE